MKLPIRSIAARTTAVALLSGSAAVAFASTANAAERRPIDRAADVVAQLIYPDPEGGVNDWTAEERVDGWLGYNSFPGGPLGHWGPGPEAAGHYGVVGAVIGGPPLPGNPQPVGGQRSPFAEAITAVGNLPAGPSEDYPEREEPELARFSPPATGALLAVGAPDEVSGDGPLTDILADVADVVLGSDEEEHEEWTVGTEPESYPAERPQSEDPPRK